MQRMDFSPKWCFVVFFFTVSAWDIQPHVMLDRVKEILCWGGQRRSMCWMQFACPATSGPSCWSRICKKMKIKGAASREPVSPQSAITAIASFPIFHKFRATLAILRPFKIVAAFLLNRLPFYSFVQCTCYFLTLVLNLWCIISYLSFSRATSRI